MDFAAGSRFAHADAPGEHPAHDTRSKRLRHLHVFVHECHPDVRAPRVRLPDGSARMVAPAWAGQPDGFTFLFEPLVLAMCTQMTFFCHAAYRRPVVAPCARFVLMRWTWHWLRQTCRSSPRSPLMKHLLDVDTTTYAGGRHAGTTRGTRHARTPEHHSDTTAQFADSLADHLATPDEIASVNIDMSPAFIKGVGEHVPKARVTFDKCHVLAHASAALDTMRGLEQKTDRDLKGLR